MTSRNTKQGGLNRRTFLRGMGALGAVSMAMPLLPSTGYSASSDYPGRLIVFFSGNGTIPENWTPESENGRITSMSTILKPLERHLNKISVIEGLDIDCAKAQWQPKGGFHAHERGLGGILTGQHLLTGTYEAESGYANGISVDQFIANEIRDPNAMHSTQIGLVTRYNKWRNRETLCYSGTSDPKFHENDGSLLFSSFFGEGNVSDEVYRRIQLRRQRVLDFLKDDLTEVKKEISAADRIRLENHEQRFVSLENELQMPAPQCSGDPVDGSIDWMNISQMDRNSDFKLKQLAMAMACDRTRVATIQFGAGLGALNLNFMNQSDSWHALSHEGDNNGDARGKLTDTNAYIAGRFAKLLDELDAIPEGEDGETLLDHSVVLWVNELGKGNNHNHSDVPIVMAGGLHNKIMTGGRHFNFGERSTNDLLITLCHAFGMTGVNEFGIPDLCSGPISELLV